MQIFVSLRNSLMILMLGCAVVWGQATAQISGTVRDQSGAVLPGVEITATQTDTGIVRTTVTNETGSFVLPNLAVGPYKLDAALPGFRTFVQNGIVLQVNGSPVVNPVLEVGQVSEQVEVQANAALVETRNAGVGQVIENQRILELPLNGRQVSDLITLAGAAVQTASSRVQNGSLEAYIQVGGALGYAVDYTLDGASHINFVTGANMSLPFPDALQEFKVETTGVNAQHGNASAVGGVTKSGTNEFHGDLFEFVRNDLFNARNYFATKSSTLKRNQFGGTIGGPVIANRLFFFGGFQGTTVRQDPADTQAFVPTPAILAGDWTAFTSPTCNAGRLITLRAPFVNNRIDPSLYSKAALNIAAKLPKTNDPCGLAIFGNRTKNNTYQSVGRVDYQLTPKQSLFGRYLITSIKTPNPFNTFTPDNILNTRTDGADNLNQSLTVGDTLLVGPNTVQAFRFAYNRAVAHRIGSEFFSYCDMGIKIDCTYAKTRTGVLTVTGGFAFGNGSTVDDNRYKTYSYSLNDDVSIVRGDHQFSFGGSFMYAFHDDFTHFVSGGTMGFNGQATGLGMGDFLTGSLSTLTMGGPARNYVDQHMFAMYGTDTWKASRKLTANYGVRWEPYLPQRMVDGRVYSFDYARFQQGTKSNIYKNAPAGFYYPGDPGFPDKSGMYKKWANFAPRLGLAWDVNGDGRTSVRASYSYSYNYISAQWHEDPIASPPWANITSLTSVSFDDPWANFPGGNPFPVVQGANARFTSFGNFQSVPYDIQTPTASAWNLSVQRQVGSNWLASASYIGNLATHVWAQKQLNPAIYIPGVSSTANTNQRRRFNIEKPGDGGLMGLVGEIDAGATANYHGMLLSLQRQAARDITVSGNYTWSHCISDYADLNSIGPDQAETYTDPNNRRADRGNCNSDRRHILNFTAVAETPQFGNPRLRKIGSGWRLSTIYRWSAGQPFTVINGSDRNLTGIDNQRANQVLGDPYLDKSGRPLSQFLNPAAFALPALGTTGNLGRGNIQGPPTWSFDVALLRAFRMQETRRLEFRVEAYNLTNTFRPSFTTTGASLLGLSLAGNTFGQIRNALDPRIMQFAVKYVF
jgi:Carboxypeptidase regulatory-like domain